MSQSVNDNGRETKMRRRHWFRWIVIVFVALLLTRALWLEPYLVTSSSMAPTYQVGDRLLVDKQVFEWRSPRRWETVVFRGPEGMPYVKRVVGLPGETIQLQGGEVYINGELSPRPAECQPYECKGRHAISAPYRLGDDEFFLLGDNSLHSNDSRNWPSPGVPRSTLVGKPIWNRRP